MKIRLLILYFFVLTVLSCFGYAIGFTQHSTPYFANQSDGVATADINNDSYVDVITPANANRNIIWYEGSSNNNYSTYHLIANQSAWTNRIYSVDIDKDGDMDIFAGTQETNNYGCWWMENVGLGTSWIYHWICPSSANNDRTLAIFPIDLDEDGWTDLLMGTAIYGTSSQIRWYSNNGDGTFAGGMVLATISGSGANFIINDLYAGDINNDSYIDIAYTGYSQYYEETGWLENDGAESFTKHIISNNHFRRFELIDLDKDGDLDMVVTGNNKISWHKNNGTGSFSAIINVGNLSNSWGIDIYDYDVDGDLDIVSGGGSLILLLENNGSQSFTQNTISVGTSSGNRDIVNADIDKDSGMDFVYSNYGTIDNGFNGAGWYENSFASNVSYVCNDSDGTDYFNYGYVNDTFIPYLVYDICESNFSGNYSDPYLYEQICYLGSWDYDYKNCKDYGVDYYCNNGVCSNFDYPPVITNVTDLVTWVSLGVRRYQNNNWYLQGENITYNVTSYDLDGDGTYYAVDCDKNDLVGISGWVGTTNTSICTYSNMTNYTARVYATDFSHFDYTVYMDVNISVRQCYSPSGCTAGYDCQGGWCVIPQNVTSCVDTDGGQFKDIAGSVITNLVTRNDTCGSYTTVLEYYCSNSSGTGYYNTPLACDAWQYCYPDSSGAYCANATGLTAMTLYVKDLTSSVALSAITYTVYDLNTSVVSTGIVTNYVTLALTSGDLYSIDLVDNADNYKEYYEPSILPSTSYIAYMERQAVSPSVFKDVFSYADNPSHHGWTNVGDYQTDYDTDYGMSLFMTTNSSLTPIYQTFPASTQDYVTVLFDVVMSKVIPANGEDLWVYVSGGGNDIVLVRYYVDEVNGNTIYVWLGEDWVQVPAYGLFFTNQPFRTKIVIDRTTGKFDFYVDKLLSGDYVRYGETVSTITNVPVTEIKFLPVASPYGSTILIDNIDISQATSAQGTAPVGDVTNPSEADLESAFYRDDEGVVKFNAEACSGWSSYILCALFKEGTRSMAKGVAWIFSGTHILFFIVALLIIIIVGPLAVELFRPKE